MNHLLPLVLILFILGSCNEFIKSTQDDYYQSIDSKKVHLFHSHNIQGETHPCGCRNFPLGGLPRVYAVIKSSKNPRIYVDTGDTFFMSSTIPDTIKESSLYTAKKIAEAMDILGLKYFVPGEYDYAMGASFLEELSKRHKFKFLLTNASEVNKVQHIKYDAVKMQEYTLIFLGLVSPEKLKPEYKSLYTTPTTAIENSLKIIKQKFKDQKYKIVLLSHLGMGQDKTIAKKYPQINWILGAHDQAYLKEPETIGNTNIVQVLSRNHHLGDIQFSSIFKEEAKYSLVQIEEKTQNLIKDNPMDKWLDNYKLELEKIQEKEQEKLGTLSIAEEEKAATNLSCLDCHDSQYKFWQGTSHSIAFLTLIKSQAMNNSSCIECHSLKFQEPKGFVSTKKIIQSQKENFNTDKYLDDLKKIVPNESIRSLDAAQRVQISEKWHKLDAENKVSHNFSNVQCLHCHTNKSADHAFTDSPESNYDFKSQCIKCHTADQSPEWYQKDSKGVATSLNNEYFAQKLKLVSCPKIEN